MCRSMETDEYLLPSLVAQFQITHDYRIKVTIHWARPIDPRLLHILDAGGSSKHPDHVFLERLCRSDKLLLPNFCPNVLQNNAPEISVGVGFRIYLPCFCNFANLADLAYVRSG
ncbi:uncharacterized protein FOMMEDRAFT_23121 [Fomitiporia mediterranea MF3/22]|uniref:uncharacterized protein n=1 Tax=Fomitiporia mediterranea (strain MF3/22) TaxID=694068 RepID=UPI000440950D|nr:uncharacterized protein FOMMEDRAFT_23121 [Fomitiporia mediterranea MF3/22]EJC99223.1 hypothetical protein FOMMEDRAFT_23121 [Fomitiporia mediterranea MF3/22]